MRPSPTWLMLVLALWTTLACQTGARAGEPKDRKPEPFVPLPDEGPESIGFFLTRLDTSLKQWSELRMAASGARDRNTLAALEHNLGLQTKERRGELLDVLDQGAPLNRRIAAVALGFTHDPTVLGPLLAHLDDSDPELVQKALLGVGILGLAETPLTQIRFLMSQSRDAWTRNNAAFALLSIASAGNRSPELLESCRAGCSDSDPGVRAQCASTLGILARAEALPELTVLLQDESNLVALASASALASVGRGDMEHKGAAARSLADSLDRVQADRRLSILRALVWLSEQNLGEDAAAWREWAYKLP